MKALRVFRNALQRGYDDRRVIGHFDAGLNRAFGLSLEVFGAAIPELRDVEDGVEHGGGIARAFLPTVADGGGQVVVAAHAEIVATVAADRAAFRETWIEEKHFAQLAAGGCDGVALECRDAVRDGFKQRLGLRDERGVGGFGHQ